MSDDRDTRGEGESTELVLRPEDRVPAVLPDASLAEPSGRLDALLARKLGAGWLRPARIVVLLLLAFFAWAYTAELDEVAIAQGEVVPQGNVKVIQHLEGGIVRQIHVAEGDAVAAGDPLISLDLGVAALNVEELTVQLDAMRLRRARLYAEAHGEPVAFPEEVAARRPDLAEAERAIGEARRREVESSLVVLRQQLTQRELEIDELHAMRAALESDLGVARELLGISYQLLGEGLSSRIEHLTRQRDVVRIEGELATFEPALPRAEAALEEARARLSEQEDALQRFAYEELAEVEIAIARTEELLATADDQALRTEIRSPIDGVVKNLLYHTIGGVVGPGAAIMEIVPSEGRLVVEARLNPIDRGYVQVGQPAVVKISTYEFVRYGGLDGTVAHIAADSDTDPSGQPYFRVIVHTEDTDLGDGELSLPITAGMQAQVDIHTGERSVFDYLLRPVLKLAHESFRER